MDLSFIRFSDPEDIMRIAIRPLVGLASILFLLAVTVTPATAQSDQETFRSLYEGRIKSVTATPDRTDDVALANELLAVARTISGQEAMLTLLCDAAYDLAGRSPGGYATAVEAQQLLAEEVRGRRADAHEKLTAILTRQLATGPAEERERAGVSLIELLLVIGEEQAGMKSFAQAQAAFRRAVTVAAQMRSPMAETARSRLEWAVAQDRSLKQLARLDERLLKDANDHETAREIVMIHVMDFDDPAAAQAYLSRVKDEQLASLVALASKSIDALESDQAMTLGDWYRAASAMPQHRFSATPLARAEKYYRRYLNVEYSANVQRTKAELMLKEIQATREKQLPKSPPPKEEPVKTQPGRGSALVITQATYGVGDIQVDVTEKIRGMVRDDRLTVTADNAVAGRDPRPFNLKRLVVKYTVNGKPAEASAREGDVLAIFAPLPNVPRQGLVILEAKYGARDRWTDITANTTNALRAANSTSVPWGHLKIEGDPASGARKAVVIYFSHRGKTSVKIFYDGTATIELP